MMKMKKNVLIISSSPRHGGNSDLLCDEFMQGAENAGHRVEKIRCSELTIHYCRGCGVCNAPDKGCLQKDDMDGVLEKMLAADVIVMATPVYFYTLCGQMKTLIDRTVSRYTELRGKEFYFIMAAAEENRDAMQRTVECFRGFLDCLDDAVEKGVIYGTGAWQAGEVRQSSAMQEARAMGAQV